MVDVKKLYKKLLRKYKKPSGQWKLWCKRSKNEKEREEIIIGAILTQNTNWKNVELAINNLKKAHINSLREIYLSGIRKLEKLIKPSGFYKSKAQYLFNLARFVVKNYGSVKVMQKVNFKKLREQLLKLKGIGQETADSILLYALNKPIFVIDKYTRRLIQKYNFKNKMDYKSLQELFEKNLPKNYRLYQDFHALIVIDGKNTQTKLKRYKNE